MKSDDELRGKAENLKGRVKQAFGTVTGDKRAEAEGAGERLKGAAKEAIGKAKRAVHQQDDTDDDDVEG